MRLSELKTGERGIIAKVYGHGSFRKRITEMGFIKGKTVQVVLNAPLKDPIEYEIIGYKISLRREEADMIEIISEQEAKERSRAALLPPIIDEENQNELTLRMKSLAEESNHTIRVALVGNPNCGKTSLFNMASGGHEHVGNYSGVTVDAKEGTFSYKGYQFVFVDLPGTYSLSAYSPEELYVRHNLIEQTPDVVINVVDASNLERNLYLTTQVIDMNLRMVMALNMYDEFERRGDKLDMKTLGHLLGMPIVPTVSRTGKGIDDLLDMVIEVYNNDNPQLARHIHINHGPELELSIDKIKKAIQKNPNIRNKYSTRFLAIKYLENDQDVQKVVESLPNRDEIISIRYKEQQRISDVFHCSAESALVDAKYGFIQGALLETYTPQTIKKRKTRTDRIDALVTNRFLGFPIFFILLYLIFEGTFTLGQYPMDGIEWLVAKFGEMLAVYMHEGPLKDLLIDGVIGGVGSVLVFLPNILILYLFISLLEDSGYMARAAFIMDRIMHKIGLHGKSFIPMIMGFGCNVPAVMATRTIESPKSRLVTMLLVPLMSCSGRLPIYLILTGAFFPEQAGLIILGLYALGILLAIIVAKLFSHFLIQGEDLPFVMELPPYRVPTAKSILRHTWEKGRQYLQKMGGVILIFSIAIWFLGYYPNHNDYQTVAEQQENSYIGYVGKAIEPILEPLGFDWKMSVGILSGIGAKELVISTLGVMYSSGADTDGTEGDTLLQNTLASSMTPEAALSYMVFVLLYFPCIATFMAIRAESGSRKWAIVSAIYTPVLAWICSSIVYQIAPLII